MEIKTSGSRHDPRHRLLHRSSIQTCGRLCCLPRDRRRCAARFKPRRGCVGYPETVAGALQKNDSSRFSKTCKPPFISSNDGSIVPFKFASVSQPSSVRSAPHVFFLYTGSTRAEPPPFQWCELEETRTRSETGQSLVPRSTRTKGLHSPACTGAASPAIR